MRLEQTIQRLSLGFAQGIAEALSRATVNDLQRLVKRPAAVPDEEGPTGSPRLTDPIRARRAPKASSKKGKRAWREATRTRRPGDVVNDLARRLADHVQKHNVPEGLAVSAIADGMQIAVAELTRPITIALREGWIRKTGERRLTRYFAGKASKKKG